MKRLALVVVLVVALGLIVWAALARRKVDVVTDVSDDVVVRFIETAVLPNARRAVGQHCTTLLLTPTTVELRLQARTEPHTVALTGADVLAGEDGGAVAPALARCVSEALVGLKTDVPRLRVSLDGGAVAPVDLAGGRAYELVVTLDLERLENPGYTP